MPYEKVFKILVIPVIGKVVIFKSRKYEMSNNTFN